MGIIYFVGQWFIPCLAFYRLFCRSIMILGLFFISIIGFHYLLKVKEGFRFSLLIVLWIIAFLYKHFFNLLPFDILNSIPAISCLYIGFLTKRKNFIKKKLRAKISMYWHPYMDCMYAKRWNINGVFCI